MHRKMKIPNKFQIPCLAGRQAKSKIQNLGFTLIELLVVISIIGILAALIMVNFNAARERARDAQRKSDLDQVKKALRMYYNDNNSYPATGGLTWGSVFQSDSGNMVYMKALPHDPSWKQAGDSDYNYTQTASGQDFCLWATLENKSDGDISKSQSRCSSCSPPSSSYNYVVCAD
jgi:general secretion pathway protein G